MENKDILELLDLCLQINNGEGPTECFFDYAGHVNRIDVRIFHTGWTEDAKSTDFELNLNRDKTQCQILYAGLKAYLEELLNDMKCA